ncbi:MAG: hypothetical protein HOK58_00995 [Acidimicrobiaceae bacterium]|nr:hypothetical protein [Acidimicrobiaceae bacterium]MBT6443547.1 hypothetical protein [Acidimicrobiaceae bacterium]MBT7429369.1 hypothetical protein [Ilumatobacter sp.]
MVTPAGNASLVGVETIAGVEAEHYTFTIEGLGAGSGARIDANDGDVWVAVDGGYVLCYDVNAQTSFIRGAPQGSCRPRERRYEFVRPRGR